MPVLSPSYALTDEEAVELVPITICDLQGEQHRVVVNWIRATLRSDELRRVARRVGSLANRELYEAACIEADTLLEQMRRLT